MYRWITLFLALVYVGFASAACGGSGNESDVVVDVEDHLDPLTAQPGDNLFTIELFEADEAYPVADLAIAVNPYGGSAAPVDFELSVDANGDGAFGVGDQLVVREGSDDTYNESHSGTLFEVVVTVTDDTGTTRELVMKQWVGDGGLG